jgi:uncharacterized protein DUF3131
MAIVAASELHLISRDEALERIRAILQTLDGLETYDGSFFNYYDTTSLERTSNFVSFVELHGGTVVAESRGESHGATFTVKLPRTIFT